MLLSESEKEEFRIASEILEKTSYAQKKYYNNEPDERFDYTSTPGVMAVSEFNRELHELINGKNSY